MCPSRLVRFSSLSSFHMSQLAHKGHPNRLWPSQGLACHMNDLKSRPPKRLALQFLGAELSATKHGHSQSWGTTVCCLANGHVAEVPFLLRAASDPSQISHSSDIGFCPPKNTNNDNCLEHALAACLKQLVRDPGFLGHQSHPGYNSLSILLLSSHQQPWVWPDFPHVDFPFDTFSELTST